MLLGCNRALATAGSVMTINNRIFALEKTSLTRENMNEKSRIRAEKNDKTQTLIAN